MNPDSRFAAPQGVRWSFDFHTFDSVLSPRLVMKFVHTTGQQLAEIVKDDEIHQGDLAALDVKDQTIVRINLHGDIEVRRTDRWDVIGGLLGDFEHRIKRVTGLDFT